MFLVLLILISSVCVYLDAFKIGARKGLNKGLIDMGPVGWLFSCMFLWIPAVPIYLINRNKIKAKADFGSPTVASVKAIAQLEMLGELHAKGLLDDNEFNSKKKQLIGSI